MKLTHYQLQKPIEFHENSIQVLTIEHPGLYRRMTEELVRQSEGMDGEFVLSEGIKELECQQSLHIIQDYFHLQPMDRKVSTKIQNMILKIAQEDLAEEAWMLQRQMNFFLTAIADKMEYSVTYDEDSLIINLIKAAGFSINFDGETMVEALTEHIGLFSHLFRNQCFILLEAKRFFEKEELLAFYKMASYQKWNVLLIESVKRDSLPGEETLIIDEDLCEIRPDEPE